jgi:hypothetical protein
VDVPADLEGGVQRGDQRERQAEVDVRGEPALEAEGARAVAALAQAEQHQPDDQQAPIVPSV